MAKSKGMGIKTSVKSGNFRPTKQGAGMTEKGVAAYRKANPGSKLKTAVTEDNPSPARAARRKSFCARSAGQMKDFPEAAKDPNSRLRQARKDGNARLFVGAIYFLLGIIGWFLKGVIDSAKQTKDDLNQFKVDVAHTYTHKNDLRDVIKQINDRFDRIEQKLDRMMETR